MLDLSPQILDEANRIHDETQLLSEASALPLDDPPPYPTHDVPSHPGSPRLGQDSPGRRYLAPSDSPQRRPGRSPGASPLLSARRRLSPAARSDPGLSASGLDSHEASPEQQRRQRWGKRSGYMAVSVLDPRAKADWRQVQNDLAHFDKLRDVRLHSEWLTGKKYAHKLPWQQCS